PVAGPALAHTLVHAVDADQALALLAGAEVAARLTLCHVEGLVIRSPRTRVGQGAGGPASIAQAAHQEGQPGDPGRELPHAVGLEVAAPGVVTPRAEKFELKPRTDIVACLAEVAVILHPAHEGILAWFTLGGSLLFEPLFDELDHIIFV